MEMYDVLIIGGGPGGYSLGIAAARHGMKVALFEKEHLGGTCLNIGCIPTKYLVDKANAMEKVRSLVDKKIFRDAGSFSFQKIQKGKNEVTGKLVSGVEYLLKKSGAEVVKGEAVLKENRVVSCGGKEYQGKFVVIATGSVPMMIPVPGYEMCIDSTGALNLPTLPDRMVVMGGGVIGLELACAFAAYGTEITVVEMMPELMPREQPEAVRLVINAMKKQGIRFLTGAKMLRIEKVPGGLRACYEQDGKEDFVDADQVLMAAGRKTNLDGIDANALGLQLDKKKCVMVDDHQRTNLPGVYAIGDVAGGYQLAHAAYAEGEAALADMLGEDRPMGTVPVPVCTYTIPCFSSVGLTVKAAKDAGYDPVLGSFSYDANGMALAEGASGAVFAVMDRKSKKTLGITIVGENSSEMIAFATMAVTDGTSAEQWEKMIVAHPSLCEMVREAALDAFGASVHKG
ncbi:MAG: dihydrolipoyl dehydrogenase [Clostridiales bacterium]|nr:dihydrolipoyl dehydrogenase [Clostridiales bacterium]